jgi:predicted amidohydrolase
MARIIKTGIVQFEGKIGEVESNAAHAVELIAEAASRGAGIVCLPELFATGYNLAILEGKTVSLGIQYYDFLVKKMSEAAKKHKINLIAPMGRKTELPGVLGNSALIFNEEGELAGYFDKSHAWALEAFYYKHGNEYPVFTINVGGISVTIGIMICYDAGFPEACRSLTLKGAEIVFCPSAWRIQDVDMWDLNMRQRALENVIFTVGVNRTGKEGDLHLFGKGKICNPRGTVVCELPMDKEVVEVFPIDLDEVVKFRSEIPYLRDRHPAAYRKLIEF